MRVIAGVDEAGRGALLGPVVAAAVVLSPDDDTMYCDSKAISSAKRERLFAHLCGSGATIGIGIVSHRVIDRINILQASLLAMRKAVLSLKQVPNEIWVDGKYIPTGLGCPARAIIGGDRLEPCISAASIVAKVIRDRLMARYHLRYPQYGLDQNKGYGTHVHRTNITKYGFSAVHRRTFSVRLSG